MKLMGGHFRRGTRSEGRHGLLKASYVARSEATTFAAESTIPGAEHRLGRTGRPPAKLYTRAARCPRAGHTIRGQEKTHGNATGSGLHAGRTFSGDRDHWDAGGALTAGRAA